MCIVPDKEQAAHASKRRIRGVAILTSKDIVESLATGISHYTAVEADKGYTFFARICKGAKMKEKMVILKGGFHCQTC
jgi:hypothetical protein